MNPKKQNSKNISVGQNLSPLNSAFSELKRAKDPMIWLHYAGSFFIASDVIKKEIEYSYKKLDECEGQDKSLAFICMKKIGMTQPALFCLTFALELAIKAVLVKQGYLKDLKSGEQLPFANHSLVQLAQKVNCLELSPNEKDILEKSSQMILSGKYPVGKCPVDSKIAAIQLGELDYYFNNLAPIYYRLMILFEYNISKETK
jgi:hypothetical protein